MHKVSENCVSHIIFNWSVETGGLLSDVEEYMYNPERPSSIIRDASVGCNVVGVTVGHSMLPNQKCVLNISQKFLRLFQLNLRRKIEKILEC